MVQLSLKIKLSKIISMNFVLKNDSFTASDQLLIQKLPSVEPFSMWKMHAVNCVTSVCVVVPQPLYMVDAGD